jgi:hypothetical protein
MQHRPFWEANNFSASQKILHILWNTQDYYVSQIDPVLALIPLWIYFNIIRV